MLLSSLFSQLIGMHLPGRYALYLTQQLNFRNPCRVGMRVMVDGEVRGKTNATQTINIHTRITDTASDTILIDGEALVKVLR